MLNGLEVNHWLNEDTVGVALEALVYKANVNLGCLFTALWEFPPGGAATVHYHVNSLRFHISLSNKAFVFLAFTNVIFVIFTLYMIVYQINQIISMKFKYFHTFSGVIDFVACILSITVIGLHITFFTKINGLSERYRRGEETTAYFNYLVQLDYAQNCVFGLLLVIGALKFLHVLRFNPIIWRFIMILKYAIPHLLAVIFILMCSFLAFASLMYLLSNGQVEMYSSMPRAFRTMFEGILGELNVDDITLRHRILSPSLYVFFLFVCTLIPVNLLIIVLIYAYRHVSKTSKPNEETDLLWTLIYKCFEYLGIKFNRRQK